jgi:multicomponent Na+:H+ antiporter subunit D
MSSAAQEGHYLVLAVLVLSTLLNAAYLLPVVHAAFFRPLSAEAEAHAHGEAPLPMVLALTATAAASIGLFFFFAPLLRFVQQLVSGAH